MSQVAANPINADSESPIVLKDVLVAEHQSIKDPNAKAMDLDQVHRLRNKSNYKALCLSGGGIRSATFNLGLLQGLAQSDDKLEEFDYLSTVSGGGFIGSWYSAWKHRDRNGAADLNDPLSSLSRKTPRDSTQTEPRPVEHLRSFSNYLSPSLGLLSADFWTLISVYLRNVCLINLVIVPVVLAVLMAPRIVFTTMTLSPHLWAAPDLQLGLVLGMGLVFGCFGVCTVAQNLPMFKLRNDNDSAYVARCLAPLTISAVSLVAFWGWYRRTDWRSAQIQPYLFRFVDQHLVLSISVVAGLLLIVPFLLVLRFKSIPALTLVTAAAALTVGLTYGVSRLPMLADSRYYVTLAFPLTFLLMMASGTLVAGLTSRYTTDSDEEWWARSGAWMMIVIITWIVMCVLVLWIPQGVLQFIDAARTDPSRLFESWKNVFIAAGPVVGAISTVLSLAGGFSSATPANDSTQSSTAGWVMSKATSLLAVVAVAFIFGTLAAFSGPILLGIESAVHGEQTADLLDHQSILTSAHLNTLLLTTVVLLVTGWVFARFIDTNKFSLHYFWRNRIVRAYVGASRDHAKSTTFRSFIGLDPGDNLPMHALRGQRPFHIVNIALNLVRSKKLNWQERLAESFTVSPLHCGTSWLGYRDTKKYASAKDTGISLGTAVAISGAAASPNMGYMMSSPVVRFLMTMFNVRLGAWMGNPGEQGNSTYTDHAPRNIIQPIIAEALGQTDDQSPYVYLSDGGHFENLGLYEMVLRRCRFIVVSDASTDPGYTYESLAQAVRKIRIDLGIPIDFEPFPVFGRSQDGNGVHCAFGTIHYKAVDSKCEDGSLIFIKPSLKGGEPRDLINYLSTSSAFPQESIADQFFSESQFESYRMLGWLIATRVFDGPDLKTDFETLSGVKRHDELAVD